MPYGRHCPNRFVSALDPEMTPDAANSIALDDHQALDFLFSLSFVGHSIYLGTGTWRRCTAKHAANGPILHSAWRSTPSFFAG
jgi:hypothetical protein